MTHFCTCQNTACRCHPSNHSQGCDLCIQKELRKGEIPSCFFSITFSHNSIFTILPFYILPPHLLHSLYPSTSFLAMQYTVLLSPGQSRLL